MDNIETIMSILTDVFRQVFDNPDIALRPEITADDVDGWDSLSHINLIMAIELRFNITFERKEIMGFKNVGAMAQCIRSKQE
jgi:acyl carrier protein